MASDELLRQLLERVERLEEDNLRLQGRVSDLARLERLEEDNATLRQQVDYLSEWKAGVSEKLNERVSPNLGCTWQVARQLTTSHSSARSAALRARERERGLQLGKEYLTYNQAAYAIAALPIGTVLSVAPLFLKNELAVPVDTIGHLMMAGELLGICFMKYAEFAHDGFIFQRPHDVHFILFCVAVSLLVIPLWSADLWVGAAIAMILVQAFNSASKPVVAEAVYRLSVIMEEEPSFAYARANKWRRLGNAVVGAGMPMTYVLSPRAAFFAASPVVACFLLLMWRCKKRVDYAAEETSLRYTLDYGLRKTKPHFRERFEEAPSPEVASCTLEDFDMPPRSSTPMRHQNSTITSIRHLSSQEFAHRLNSLLRVATLSEEAMAFDRQAPGDQSRQVEDAELALTGPRRSIAARCRFWFLLFLTVHGFPFMDAYISRLPFAYLTIAVVEQSGSLVVACVVLFSYQLCRAVGQSIQTFQVGNAVNYTLTFMSVLCYAVVLALALGPWDSGLWYLPVIPTGFSETLAVQQCYLLRLLGLADRKQVPEYVKKSHTGTGIGSAVAFFSSSFLYVNFGVLGVGSLGLAVASAKLALVLCIGNSLPPSEGGASAARPAPAAATAAEPPTAAMPAVAAASWARLPEAEAAAAEAERGAAAPGAAAPGTGQDRFVTTRMSI